MKSSSSANQTIKTKLEKKLFNCLKKLNKRDGKKKYQGFLYSTFSTTTSSSLIL